MSTFPLVQIKHFAFEPEGVFLTLENVICYLVFVCLFFLFLGSTALSVFCLLPLILLIQSSNDPFHFFSGLGVSGISKTESSLLFLFLLVARDNARRRTERG